MREYAETWVEDAGLWLMRMMKCCTPDMNNLGLINAAFNLVDAINDARERNGLPATDLVARMEGAMPDSVYDQWRAS